MEHIAETLKVTLAGINDGTLKVSPNTGMIDSIQPGLYPRGTIEYDRIGAVNISTLVKMAISPKHYKHALVSKSKQTKPMSLGVAAHAAILEPTRFESDFAIWESNYRGGEVVGKTTKKAGDSRPRSGGAWEEFKAANADKTIITDDEADEARRIASALWSDPLARMYVGGHGLAEITAVAKHEGTGILRRGRLDWLTRIGSRLCIPDLKTATDVGARFCNAAAKLAYHTKLAWYANLVETITGETPMVVIVAIENHEPYDVVCYELADDELEIGQDEYTRLLERLAECRKTNQWPGQGGGMMQKFYLPKYLYESEDDLAGLGLEFDHKTEVAAE